MEFIIEGVFITLNQYILAERSHRMVAATMKKDMTELAAWQMKGRNPIREGLFPILPRFTWFVKDLRTDADNIDFSKKFILDGMVVAGIIPDDSRKYIAGFGPCHILVDKENPRVVVEI